MPQPIYPQERTLLPNELEAGWDPQLIWMFKGKQNSLAPVGIQNTDFLAQMPGIPSFLPFLVSLSLSLLLTFAKLQRATVSFVMSVCLPSTTNQVLLNRFS